MIEIELHTKHHFSDGLYAKQMTLPKGYFAISHKHNYDHISVLWSGTALVEADGKETTHTAPAFILIKAGVNHKITAIEEIVWYCVHETDETDADNIDKVLIQGE
jgi:quercetin dioxygenase-like cupin family protein